MEVAIPIGSDMENFSVFLVDDTGVISAETIRAPNLDAAREATAEMLQRLSHRGAYEIWQKGKRLFTISPHPSLDKKQSAVLRFLRLEYSKP